MPARPDWRGRTRTVPSSDLQDRALGTGDPTGASRSAGKQNAVWASIDLTGGGAVLGTVKQYDVPHTLGEKPTSCMLERIENAAVAGTSIIAYGVREENWSHGHVHVSVTLVSGSLDGCRAHFLVKGK